MEICRHMEILHADVEFLKGLPSLRQELKDNVRGYLYDVITGTVTPAE